MGDKPDIVLIAGPTASGKSAAALEAADKWDGVIINADSMQVYDALKILSARPGEDDQARIEHRLYGHVAAERAYSVAAWLADATAELGRLRDEGRTAVLCGGTGLYFKALEEGISTLPPIDPDIRARWREFAGTHRDRLHDELARRDPRSAEQISRGDTQRLVRALEVLESTGRPLREWQQGADRFGGEALGIAGGARVERLMIVPERAELHHRINARFDQMLELGAIGEAGRLLERGLDNDLPVMKAIGVREIGAFLDGTLSLAESSERAKAATRQYAKRQITWLRHQLGDHWYSNAVAVANFTNG